MKIAAQLTILFLFVSLVPLVVLSATFYTISQQVLREQVSNQLSSIAEVQKARVKTFVERDRDRLELISKRQDLAAPVNSYTKNKNTADFEAIQKILFDIQNSIRGFEEISIVNPSGIVVASTNTSGIGSSKFGSEAFRKGVSSYSLELYKDSLGNIRMNLSSPIRLNGQLVGVIIVDQPGTDFLAMAQDYTGLGKTGEVYMAKRDEKGDALYITPLRYETGAALRNKISQYQTSHAVIQALLKNEKVFPNTIDYRNVPSIAVTRYIDTVEWGLVVKIDQSEAYAVLSQVRNGIIGMFVATFIVVVGIALFLARSFTRSINLILSISRRISEGDFSQKLPFHGHDELSDLSQAINTMSDKLSERYENLEKKVEEKTAAVVEQVENIHKVEGSVQKEKLKLEAVLNSLPVGVILAKAPNGELVLINKMGIEIFGNSMGSAQSESQSGGYEVVKKDGKPYPHDEFPLNLTLKTGNGVSKTGIYIKRPGGATTALRVSSAPIKNEKNELEYVIVIFEDMTKEEEVDKMKTEFISLASHQLRTPLSAIRWFAEMLMKQEAGALNEKQTKYSQNIYGSTRRMIGLVNSLLNISRIESGRIIVDPRPTELNTLVRGVADELKSKIDEKKLLLQIDIPTLPTMSIDPQLIREVYMNLLTNAIKYTPERGTISLSIANWGNELVTKIADTGYGIPKKQQERVFQKFFRGDNIVKVATEGTGLGLYLVKALIDASDGKVWFESEEGKGTTFWFSLPMSGSIAKEGEVGLNV